MVFIQTGSRESQTERFQKGEAYIHVIGVLLHIVLDLATGTDDIEMNERRDNKNLNAVARRYRIRVERGGSS